MQFWNDSGIWNNAFDMMLMTSLYGLYYQKLGVKLNYKRNKMVADKSETT